MTQAITPNGLLTMAQAAQDRDGDLPQGLVVEYAHALREWRDVNSSKAGAFQNGELAWFVAAGAALAELVLAVTARAF